MAETGDDPRCRHHLHFDGGSYVEPSSICSCPVGLVHIHDCPVTLGLPCVHHVDHEGLPTRTRAAELEEQHARLMEDFLAPAYRHRVRSLQPQGDPWVRRREELVAQYEPELEEAAAAETEPAERQQAEDERYEREKERLIAQRKQREEQRAAQEEKIREELAAERARRGIKTVVERARESVAAQGNVATSWLDSVELPADQKRRSRRGRGRKPAGEGAPAAEGGGTKRRRGRRRGRGKGTGAGEPSSPAGGERASGDTGGGSAPGKPKKRRRRRRRRSGEGGGGQEGGGST